MSDQEDLTDPTVNAEGDSVAIGRFSARDINAPVIFGKGNILNVYESSEGEAPLTSDEVETGLKRLTDLLPERAPILQEQFEDIARRLRSALGPDLKALSPTLRKQHEEQLEKVKQLCQDVADMSFHALCKGQNPPQYDARCPFRGLESFHPEDHNFFFGREELTKKLVARIQADSFLAVLGASGSGKSSLVMAGLIPSLELDYVIFRPGTDPLGGLKAARGKPLIVVDQFEELFTVTHDKVTRNQFITALLGATQKVIITMRSDFWGELATYRDLNEKIQTHLENIPPMNTEELRHAMEKQADQVGLRFEGDLSQRILEDVEGEPGAMPLLQHALWELWNRRHGRLLPTDEYRAFGGVKQAITRTAEKVYGECTPAEQKQIRDLFIQLTYIDEHENRRDARRRVPLNDLTPIGPNSGALTVILDKLATARLIVQTPNAKLTEVEVSHEALIRHWQRLRTWIDENRNNLIFHRQLIDDASQWARSGRDGSYLYQVKRLSEAEQWTKSNSFMLGSLEKEFLIAGRARQIREHRIIIVRWVSWGITVASLLAIAIFAFNGGLAFFIYRPLPTEWVDVPAGEFMMGSDTPRSEPDEAPVHTVYLDSFKIAKYEVTNQQYLQCVKAKICTAPDNQIYSSEEYAQHPVTNIDWTEADKFCKWINKEEVHLPSEAQWEKAARGADGGTYPWGEDIDCGRANYGECNSGTIPVGSYENGKSPYGAYDMAGNVWEWVSDSYVPDYYQTFMDSPSRNPIAPGVGPYVARGGSWEDSRYFVRSAQREWNLNASYVGFRCAMSNFSP